MEKTNTKQKKQTNKRKTTQTNNKTQITTSKHHGLLKATKKNKK